MRPTREHATNNHQTYMVTSFTSRDRSLFHVDRWAELFINTLYHRQIVAPKAATFQSKKEEKDSIGAAKAAPFQS